GSSTTNRSVPALSEPTDMSGFSVVRLSDPVEAVPDDRENIEPGNAVLLIVEDDPHYARIIADLAHDQGLKVLVAMRGSDALALAREYRPNAVSLDVFLPDMLGWTVLTQLKQDPETRHIPVQVVTVEEERQHGLERGAFVYINEPLSTNSIEAAFDGIKGLPESSPRQLLVGEDDPAGL